MTQDDRYIQRSFRQGAAIMCGRCYGQGVVLKTDGRRDEPIKCPRCGGEGLEPKSE